jgi:hypothetical protein
LGHLNSLVGLDDFPPTDQDEAVRQELTAAIEVQLASFNQTISDQLEAFNAAFTAKGLPFLSVANDKE